MLKGVITCYCFISNILKTQNNKSIPSCHGLKLKANLNRKQYSLVIYL